MININNTHWVFICGASSESIGLTRHVLDIAFGINKLLSLGVNKSNIDVLIDHGSDEWLSGVEDKLIFDGISINSISEYSNIFNSNNNLPCLVLFFLGHGTSSGIDSPTQLKPNDLCNAIYSKL
ncbi:MAG: hypothetical protein E6Q33_02445 [Neisseriales bacterium]|nr:MAG: hypothetical protein E6Q33_02445 [Neisseriales bacterium]